jgi:methionyl aminopeptidase
LSKVTTADELAGVRTAGRLAAMALKEATRLASVEKNGHDLDEKLTEYIVDIGAYPSGVGFINFPKSICISPNDVLVHGIPNKRPFQQGDWINLDVTVFKDGYYGDNSTMVVVGEVLPEIKKLVNSLDRSDREMPLCRNRSLQSRSAHQSNRRCHLVDLQATLPTKRKCTSTIISAVTAFPNSCTRNR